MSPAARPGPCPTARRGGASASVCRCAAHGSGPPSGRTAGQAAWGDVVGVLVSGELFWISTVRTNGRPHVTPLPAVWRDGALYFCTGPGEQKALNLRANDQCVLTTGDNHWKAGLDVVVEGRAEQ